MNHLLKNSPSIFIIFRFKAFIVDQGTYQQAQCPVRVIGRLGRVNIVKLQKFLDGHLNKLSHAQVSTSTVSLCLDNVEYMEKSVHGTLSSSPPTSTKTFFPSLKELELKGMGNLKGWWKVTESNDCNVPEKMSLTFTDLATLRIIVCPNLVTVPLSPNVDEIVLMNVNKDLTVLKKLTSSVVSGDVGYNLKLKKLSVDEIEDLIYLPEECLGHITSLEIMDRNLLNTSRLEEVFKCLSSLRYLKFTNCENMTSIFEGLEHLSSLDSLLLENCKELDLSPNDQRVDGMPWKALKKLSTLRLGLIPKLMHLPSGLQHLTNLRSLEITCNDMVALPKWFTCFSSLEHMSLAHCPQLASLPEELAHLTSLNALEIINCPGLTARCRGPNGSDWSKVPVKQVQRYGSTPKMFLVEQRAFKQVPGPVLRD